MLVSKTPVRISLGAGGTDLPFFYEKFGASFATAAGTKYVYVMVNRHPEKVVWMGLYRAERVDRASDLRHRLVRAVLEWMDVTEKIEIVTTSDVHPNSGLGSSSSFIVGLLHALHAYKGEYLWPEEIATEASYVERDLVKEYGGKQDQYAASLGGILWLRVSRGGLVRAHRLSLAPDFVKELEGHVAFFYTGTQRESATIQAYNLKLSEERGMVVDNLQRIQAVALDVKEALLHKDIGEFGRLMDLHWRYKKRMSPNVSSPALNQLYKTALLSGAVGGNLMGAGGGGHFLFVCKDTRSRRTLISTLSRKGLLPVDIKFEMQGSIIAQF